MSGIRSFAVAGLQGVRNTARGVKLKLLVALALDRPGDENGDRYVELIIEGRLNEESKFQIKTSNDANANLKLKQGIETLHQDLTGKIVVGKLDSLSMNELEIMELKERKKKEENE